MLSRKPSIPEDLQGIDAALRRSRPELPEDRTRFIAAEARSRARASAWNHTPQKEPFLRSRIAILSMLVLGFGFSGAGVGMAVNGVPEPNTSASDAQYDDRSAAGGGSEPTLDGGGSPEVAGENARGNDEVPGDTEEVAGDTDDQAADEQAVQETRQLGAEESGDELPFTGFAAIPVLLMGVALLSAGFVLRRRA